MSSWRGRRSTEASCTSNSNLEELVNKSNLKKGMCDQAYVDLSNDCQYWEERCLGEEAAMAQMDVIMNNNIQTLYNEWKNKYVNMAMLTNYALQDFPKK